MLPLLTDSGRIVICYFENKYIQNQVVTYTFQNKSNGNEEQEKVTSN